MIDWKNSRVLVVGLGKSGKAAVKLLLELGASVTGTDERAARDTELEVLGVPILAQTAETFVSGFDLIVLSPGVPLEIDPVLAARKHGTPVIGEVELASYFLKGPVIGITGANGKTTTTALIGHILQSAGVPVQVGGNIGVPPTAMVATSNFDQWNVLELSSFQLETISHFQAHIAVGLNVTPDHLDRHGSFENYAAAKARLFETQGAGDYAVLNAADAVCVSYAALTKAQVNWFRVSSDLVEGVLHLQGSPLMPASEVPLRGLHNVENVLAASLASSLAGVEREAIASGVRSFGGVPHRIEFVRERNGVQFFNDSKATNVDATIKAIEAFPGPLWLILGGKDKNSDYRPLRDKLDGKLGKLLLIGAAAEKIRAELSGLAYENSVTLAEAVKSASKQARPGDVVLLAPACASFDQFQNYEHRGEVFKELVRSL